MESIPQVQQVDEETSAEEAKPPRLSLLATEAAFAHVSTPPDAVHVDLVDDTLIGEHNHAAGRKLGCGDDGMISVDLSEEFPKDLAQANLHNAPDVQTLGFGKPSTVFPDQASTLSSSEQQDAIVVGMPYMAPPGSICRQDDRRREGTLTETLPDCDTLVQARVSKLESYISAIASEVMQERQAREALTAVCDERFRSIEEVVDRITTDLDRLAAGLDKLGPLFSDPATMNLERKFEAASADQTQAFTLLAHEVDEYKVRVQSLEKRCGNFASTKAVGECAARVQLLDERYNEFIAMQADSELEQQEAITSVTKDISAAYDVHKSQIIKVTENMTWLGKELQHRLEHVETIVADEMKARLEHLEIVVAAQKVGLEKLRSEHGTPVKQHFGHDEDWQKEKKQLTNQVNRLSQDVSAAMKRVNDSEGAILAAVVDHLTKLAESIPRADRNYRKVGVTNRVSRSRSLRISSQGSGTTISISNSPSAQSRQLESDASQSPGNPNKVSLSLGDASQSPGHPNKVSLSLAAADAFINFAPEANSVGSSRPSKESSQSRSSSLNVKRSTSSSPTRETSATRARERRSASPLPRCAQSRTLELPTFESLIEELVHQATKRECSSGEFPGASSSANKTDKEPLVSEATVQVARSVAKRANELLASEKEDASREERQKQAQSTSSEVGSVRLATSSATTLPLQPPKLHAQISVPQLPQLQQQPINRAVASVRLPAAAGVGEVGVQPPSGPMVVRSMSSLLPTELVASQHQICSMGQPEALRRSRSPEKVGRLISSSSANGQMLGSEPLRSATPTPTPWGGSKEATPFLTPRSIASGCILQAPLVIPAQTSHTGWRHSAHSIG